MKKQKEAQPRKCSNPECLKPMTDDDQFYVVESMTGKKRKMTEAPNTTPAIVTTERCWTKCGAKGCRAIYILQPQEMPGHGA